MYERSPINIENVSGWRRRSRARGKAAVSERLGCSQRCNRGATAMRKLSCTSGADIGLALLPPSSACHAEGGTGDRFWQTAYVRVHPVLDCRHHQRLLHAITRQVQGSIGQNIRGARSDPLRWTDTPVVQRVRIMTAEKIGALIVMDGERLTGIFTERDALPQSSPALRKHDLIKHLNARVRARFV